MHGLCREGNAGRVPAVALAGRLHPVTVPGPAVSAAVALPVRSAGCASCTWAFAMGTGWTTTPEFGTRTKDVGSEEFVVLMLAAPHPPQRAECRMRSAVNRSCLGYNAGDCLDCVWVAPDVAF